MFYVSHNDLQFEPHGIGVYIDDADGVTQESIAFFRQYKEEFGQITDAYIFQEPIGGLGLRNQKAPIYMVLRSEGPNYMYLSGCNCGYSGEGPHGSVTVLREAGFQFDPNIIFNTYGVWISSTMAINGQNYIQALENPRRE